MVHEIKLDVNHLAARERIKPGFFSMKDEVDIPQGVNAVVWEKGQNCGEIGPGRHTMTTFKDRLFLNSDKEQVLYAVNSGVFPITYFGKFLTKECVSVDCAVTVEYTVENRYLFLGNLFGARDVYSKADFNVDTQNIVLAAIRDSIVMYGVKELVNADFQQYFTTTLDTAVSGALGRYGIKFRGARIETLSWEGMDEQNASRSKIWMVKEGQAIRKEEWEAEVQGRLDEISHQEKVNDLEMLAKQTAADRQDGELTLASRKMEQQKTLRKIIQAQEFDKITTQAEMDQFLFEQEKAGLLRENERKEIIKNMTQQNVEADKRRDFLLEQLDLQMERQLETEKNEYIFRSRMTAMEHEEALARKAASLENEKWLRYIQEEKAKRIETRAALVDELEIQRAITEVELERENRQLRLDRIAAERGALERDVQLAHEKMIEEQRLELQKMQKEQEIEIQTKAWKDDVERQTAINNMQIAKMEAINELNRKQELFEYELWERRIRLEKELERLAKQDEYKFELDRLRIIQTYNRDTILTVLTPEQTQAWSMVNAPAAQNTQAADANAALVKTLLERLEDQTKIAKENDDRLERIMGQVLQSMTAVSNQAPAAQPVIVTGTGQPIYGGAAPQAPAEPKRVVICPQCRSEVQENAKFCMNCGKEL